MKLSTILELVKIVTNAMNNPKNQAEQWPTLLNGGTSGLSLIGSLIRLTVNCARSERHPPPRAL